MAHSIRGTLTVITPRRDLQPTGHLKFVRKVFTSRKSSNLQTSCGWLAASDRLKSSRVSLS